MSLCENDEGEHGGREKKGGAGGQLNFINGILKDGFKLEVISMFMFERRKSKKMCVSV